MRNERPREFSELRASLTQAERDRRRDIEADQLFEHPRRLILRSPDGHYWQLSVDDTGTLATTDLGTDVP
jgi:hypothetical protein